MINDLYLHKMYTEVFAVFASPRAPLSTAANLHKYKRVLGDHTPPNCLRDEWVPSRDDAQSDVEWYDEKARTGFCSVE